MKSNTTGQPTPLLSIFNQATTEQKQLTGKPISWLNAAYRKQFIKLLSNIKNGHIALSDSLGKTSLGEPSTDLKCTIHINHPNAYSSITLGGSNGAAQAYIDGLWHCDNPSNLIRILVRNRNLLDQMESGLARIAQYLLKIWHAKNHNSISGSRKNISAHYDLSNDFFRLWLDKKMMYSSALYADNDTLQEASDRKLQRICDTLEISAKDHVLEIGSGWGGFACYAAQQTGCHVTTITISQEQYNEASKRVASLSLQQQVTVKLLDYRDLDGQYDKVVSIEMIEAVGHHYLDNYFSTIYRSLKPNGKALIQAIVLEDHRYKQSLKEVDFIKRYIFPGSFIPCYSVITQTAGQNQLMLENLFDMGLSYAQTLHDWRRNFYQKVEEIRQQGFDDEFLRMWEFYLCYCEGGFQERAISVGQLLFRKQTL